MSTTLRRHTTAMKSVPNLHLGIGISVAISTDDCAVFPQQRLSLSARTLVATRPQESQVYVEISAVRLESGSTITFHHRTGARHSYRRLHLVVPKVWRKSAAAVEPNVDQRSSGGRIHVNLENDAIRQHIDAPIQACFHTCEVCGQPGR
jgi:hypothetical protein